MLEFTPYKLGRNLETLMSVDLLACVINVTGEKNDKGVTPYNSSPVTSSLLWGHMLDIKNKCYMLVMNSAESKPMRYTINLKSEV